jgi:hypothetical protein
MSDNKDWYLETTPKPSLRMWIFQNMAMGAIYAALVFFGIILFILALRALAGLLPEDPFALLDAGVTTFSVLV